jgi:ribosome assembly protein 3
MQKSAEEFSDDLDVIRGADDFNDKALPLLVTALQQGASIFSKEDQRRVSMASGSRK